MANTTQLQRHHWLNAYVGVLDAAFHLTEEEQFAVANILQKLLTHLRVPDRGTPDVLPMPIAQELHFAHYSLQLESRRSSHLNPDTREVSGEDCVTSLEAWRAGLSDMVTVPYPGLSAEERLLLTKTMTDLLAAIGVPNRAASHFPPAVINAHLDLDNR